MAATTNVFCKLLTLSIDIGANYYSRENYVDCDRFKLFPLCHPHLGRHRRCGHCIRSALSSDTGSTTNGGAIAGGVLGGLAGIGILAFLVLFFVVSFSPIYLSDPR